MWYSSKDIPGSLDESLDGLEGRDDAYAAEEEEEAEHVMRRE